MVKVNLNERIEIPEGVEVTLEKIKIIIKGEKGILERRSFYPGVEIKQENSEIALIAKNATKREKMSLKTLKAHIKNMIIGVSDGFEYKLRICSEHFPMAVTHEENNIVIKNFLGEKIPRISKIIEGVNVEIKKDIIELNGSNIESVGQTAANLETSTKISNRDRRRFQDGIFITEKAGKEV